MSQDSQMRERPDRSTHFYNRAKTASERSTCLRRKVGAVIINQDGVEIASGYVGSPRGTEHCIDIGKCLRRELGIPSGQNYELCRSVHAEQNCIINAARIGVSIIGSEMYISSERIMAAYPGRSRKRIRIYGPCIICKKEIINAGIKKVHMREEGIGEKTYTIKRIKRMLDDEENKRMPVIKYTKKHDPLSNVKT